MNYKLNSCGLFLVALLWTSSAASAQSSRVKICNESGSDIALTFVWQEGLDVLRGNWRGAGGFLVRSQSCDTFFTDWGLFYRVNMNARRKGWLGGWSDLDTAKASWDASGGKSGVGDQKDRYCLTRVGTTAQAVSGDEAKFLQCTETEKALFAFYIIKDQKGSVDIVIR